MRVSYPKLLSLCAIILAMLLGRQPSFSDSATSFDWISIKGDHFVDSSGRLVILHGYVVPVNVRAGIIQYTLQDYQRMRLLGANYQSIRLFAGSLGAWPGTTPAPAYLAAVDNMVQLGKQVGIYADFKLTLYGLPNEASVWDDFWNNSHGEQAAVLAAWQALWQKYKDEPAVVGYDLLNEPQPSGLQNATPDSTAQPWTGFADTQLLPLYQSWINTLQRLDQRHLALFQPLYVPKVGFAPFSSSIQRERAVYNVHFYPHHGNFPADTWFTPNYAATLDEFLRKAQSQATPMMVGEYGHPWSTKQDGKAKLEAQEQTTEEGTAILLDSHLLSFSRPWFANDLSGTPENGASVGWAIFQGTDGFTGPDRAFITDVVARVFSEHLSGQQLTIQNDFTTHQTTLSYTPSAGVTLLYIPHQHAYSHGFTIQHSAGITLAYDASQPTGLRITQQVGTIPDHAFTWNETMQELTIQEWASDAVTIRITLTN